MNRGLDPQTAPAPEPEPEPVCPVRRIMYAPCVYERFAATHPSASIRPVQRTPELAVALLDREIARVGKPALEWTHDNLGYSAVQGPLCYEIVPVEVDLWP